MRNVDVPAGTRLWAAIVLGVLFLAAAPLTGAAMAMTHSDIHAHTSDVGLYDHLFVAADHAHIDAGAGNCGVDDFADAIASRPRTTLLASSVLVGLVVLWSVSRNRGAVLDRAPPRAVVLSVGGSDLLTRLCVARC